MSTRTLHLLLLALITALWIGPLSEATAQRAPGPLDSSSPPRAWIATGIGIGSGAGQGVNGSVGASINVGWPGSDFVGQVAINGNWSPQARSNDETLPYAGTIGLSLGHVWARPDITIAGFAGPALARERTLADTSHHAGGLLLGSQLFVTPVQGFGLGLDAFAFLHPNYSQVGIRMAVQLGSAWLP